MYLYLLPKFAIIYKNSKGGFLMRIYNWLNKNKDSENILIQLLRLIYTVEISTPVHVILSSIIGIFIPPFNFKASCIVYYLTYYICSRKYSSFCF